MFCTPHKPSGGSQSRSDDRRLENLQNQIYMIKKQSRQTENHYSHGRDLGMKSFWKTRRGQEKVQKGGKVEDQWAVIPHNPPPPPMGRQRPDYASVCGLLWDFRGLSLGGGGTCLGGNVTLGEGQTRTRTNLRADPEQQKAREENSNCGLYRKTNSELFFRRNASLDLLTQREMRVMTYITERSTVGWAGMSTHVSTVLPLASHAPSDPPLSAPMCGSSWLELRVDWEHVCSRNSTGDLFLWKTQTLPHLMHSFMWVRSKEQNIRLMSDTKLCLTPLFAHGSF